MPKRLIPKNIKKELKKSIKRGGGQLAQSTTKEKQNLKRKIRRQQQTGETKRSKITWSIAPGDLVMIKKKNKGQQTVVGIILHKKAKINYNNQEEEYVIMMTPNHSNFKISPKRLKLLQGVKDC
tara:strand:- start:5596 stop:5967 length:372 start_codon:yes stop_codon:yes gene_type:complete